MKKKNVEVDFDKLVKIFNENGKKAAVEFVKEEYKSSYALIQRKIRKKSNYYFNINTRKYELRTDNEVDFMTIEELCEGKTPLSSYSCYAANYSTPRKSNYPHLEIA